MTTEHIINLIDQAAQIGIRKFDITGGEFFMQPDWQSIVGKFLKHGYFPEISTKIPLTKECIDQIVKTGLPSIQFSLDTLNPYLAQKTLNVKESYVDQIKESIKYADEQGLNIIIKPTLNRLTCTLENIKEVLAFTDSLNNVSRCVVSIAGYSNFKSHENYIQYRPTDEQIQSVKAYIDEIIYAKSYSLHNDNQILSQKDLCNFIDFQNRSMCSANVDGFVILPDGKVTICEELYWNPNFIIGDTYTNSLMDIWNSDKAIQLWNIQKNHIPEQSACRHCQDLLNCRSNKGVCWKYVVAAYGDNNIFHPDPRCPKAPAPEYNITGE